MKICIPIRENNLKKAILQVKKASKKADFVEIWLDRFGGEGRFDQVKRLIKASNRPVIAVCRAKIEKGDFQGTEKERIFRLEQAALAGATYIDIGVQTEKTLIARLKKTKAKLIISHHIWSSTPDINNLTHQVNHAFSLGADIAKIATTVKNWSDNVTLFELTKRMKAAGKSVIIVGMGEKGKISRIGCPMLGSFLTYAALDEKSKTADGQLTYNDIVNF